MNKYLICFILIGFTSCQYLSSSEEKYVLQKNSSIQWQRVITSNEIDIDSTWYEHGAKIYSKNGVISASSKIDIVNGNFFKNKKGTVLGEIVFSFTSFSFIGEMREENWFAQKRFENAIYKIKNIAEVEDKIIMNGDFILGNNKREIRFELDQFSIDSRKKIIKGKCILDFNLLPIPRDVETHVQNDEIQIDIDFVFV